jgi:hypothetical protein
MIRNRAPFLTIPIHRRSESVYYRKAKAYEARKEAGFPVLAKYEGRYEWPPWYFNDVVAILRTEAAAGNVLEGYIYLRRKLWPRTGYPAAKRQAMSVTGLRTLPAKREHFLFWWELTKRTVLGSSNDDFVREFGTLISEAQEKVRINVPGCRGARATIPLFDLSCIDFVRAMSRATAT